MKTINDYEKKTLIVADFVQHTDGKVDILIIDNDDEILYDGRQEYLAWTGEGVADKVCDRIVNWFDISSDTKIVLYLE